MFFQLPNARNPLSRQDGTTQDYWYRFFSSIYARPSPESLNTVTASPYSFQAPFNGNLLISGGTVQQIQIIRATTTITGLTAGIIYMGRGDQVVITYTVVPTVTFYPS